MTQYILKVLSIKTIDCKYIKYDRTKSLIIQNTLKILVIS